MFTPLRNTALFKAVRVEQGGYAISRNDVIDISEYELWNHGQSIKYPIELDNLASSKKSVGRYLAKIAITH
uniref:Uncharacterized protein n=1 Tax=Candidatus Kentrum sp. SD TaxID=2126332 RepID=A0A451BJX3_9GAMM|nr:MAG: hypothetical protein BECKSD772D_GA0070982_101832 [Candidatus Kentron sp. SD]